jgi:hypothetical protein
MVFDRVEVEIPTTGGHWAFISGQDISLPMTGNTEALPNQMSVVVKGYTPSRRRAKKFLPCLLQTNNDANVINSSPRATLQTGFADNWLGTFTSGAVTWSAAVCKPNGSDPLLIGSTTVNRMLGTQRRRKQGSGS